MKESGKVKVLWNSKPQSGSMFPQDYLDMVGLSGMFPRVEVYLIQGSAVGMLEKPPMEGQWWPTSD